MQPLITVFERSPDGGRGLGRDMPVRWALEESGQPYSVRTVPLARLKEAPHLARNPFGQIPTYEQDGLVLFESGAIVLHIATRTGGLLPDQPEARARAIAWMFAALSTVEPPILERETAILAECSQPWAARRLPLVEERVRARLRELSHRLGEAPWLDGPFGAGDLMMVAVLRRLASSTLLAEFPKLAGYVARGEARPAFQRAFAAQLATWAQGA